MLWNHRKRQKRKEEDGILAGASVGQKIDIGEMLLEPLNLMMHGGNPFNLMTFAAASADVAISGGAARRGQAPGAVLGAAAAQGAGLIGYQAGKVLGGAIGSELLPVFGTVIGAFVGGAVGALASDAFVRTGVVRALDKFKATGSQHVRFGGYTDTQPAYNRRQKAEQELSGSLLNARRYLGREAQLMHQ